MDRKPLSLHEPGAPHRDPVGVGKRFPIVGIGASAGGLEALELFLDPPFTSILLYPELPEDARAVLDFLVLRERRVATQDQRWFKVRIMPYRTLEDRIDGVVLTFSDRTAAHALEMALADARAETPPSQEQP